LQAALVNGPGAKADSLAAVEVLANLRMQLPALEFIER